MYVSLVLFCISFALGLGIIYQIVLNCGLSILFYTRKTELLLTKTNLDCCVIQLKIIKLVVFAVQLTT